MWWWKRYVHVVTKQGFRWRIGRPADRLERGPSAWSGSWRIEDDIPSQRGIYQCAVISEDVAYEVVRRL